MGGQKVTMTHVLLVRPTCVHKYQLARGRAVPVTFGDVPHLYSRPSNIHIIW
jgi:hypothetical protein